MNILKIRPPKLMQLKWVAIISAIGVIITIGIITALNENPFIPLDQNQQAVQLALSDPNVKQLLGDKPYAISFGSGLPTDSNDHLAGGETEIRFIFKDNSYVVVFVNTFQHTVIGANLVPYGTL